LRKCRAGFFGKTGRQIRELVVAREVLEWQHGDSRRAGPRVDDEPRDRRGD